MFKMTSRSHIMHDMHDYGLSMSKNGTIEYQQKTVNFIKGLRNVNQVWNEFNDLSFEFFYSKLCK